MKNFLRRLFARLSDDSLPLPRSRMERLEDLCRRMGYQFRDRGILVQALKHRSYLVVENESRIKSNERLELLGDAVLGLVVTEHLYSKHPEKEEGDLTAIKSVAVSRSLLARMARQMSLGDYVLLSEGEERAGGRNRNSINSDAFEALIGAIYLDGGLGAARDFIRSHLLANLDSVLKKERNRNYKSALLEYAQANTLGLPHYQVVHEEGPDHDKVFTIVVRVDGEALGKGVGPSKKLAEQKAAADALEQLHVGVGHT